MACTPWMPAAQEMPDYALATGRSFRLQFILLVITLQQDGQKGLQEEALASERMGKQHSFEQPLD